MDLETTTAKPPSPAGAKPQDGLPPEQRRWAVAAIFTALAMASLDTVDRQHRAARDRRRSACQPGRRSVWVVNVYQITLVATLLPLGALGEIVGHQRIYLGGLLLFTLASLGCAWRGRWTSLLVARTLQGLGASGMMSVNTALVRFVYPSRMLGRGFGHNALVVATAFTLGPTMPPAFSRSAQWPWLFAVNSLRPDRDGDRLEDTAGDAARRARLRFSRCGAGGGLSRPFHHRASAVPAHQTIAEHRCSPS